MSSYMNRRRAKLLAAIAAVPLAIWAVWAIASPMAAPAAASFRPDMEVRYVEGPHPGGGLSVRVECRSFRGAYLLDAARLDGWYGWRDAGNCGAGATLTTVSEGAGRIDVHERRSGVFPTVRRLPAGEWHAISKGEGVLLAEYTSSDGVPIFVRAWCAPRGTFGPEPPVPEATGRYWPPEPDPDESRRAARDATIDAFVAAHPAGAPARTLDPLPVLPGDPAVLP